MNGMGRIHLYTGCGKGKTTAAVGLTVRLIGRGGAVVFAQFLKGENSGERAVLAKLPGVDLLPVPGEIKFVFQMTSREKEACAQGAHGQFLRACEAAAHADLLVLDEILDAIETGMLAEDAVLDYLRHKPASLEVVLTGRRASDTLKELADYVMRVDSEKHPYERGLPAREGIEF